MFNYAQYTEVQLEDEIKYWKLKALFPSRTNNYSIRRAVYHGLWKNVFNVI